MTLLLRMHYQLQDFQSNPEGLETHPTWPIAVIKISVSHTRWKYLPAIDHSSPWHPLLHSWTLKVLNIFSTDDKLCNLQMVIVSTKPKKIHFLVVFMDIVLLSKLQLLYSCLRHNSQNIRKEWILAKFLLSSEPKGYQKRGFGRREKRRVGQKKQSWCQPNALKGSTWSSLQHFSWTWVVHFTYLLFQDRNRR